MKQLLITLALMFSFGVVNSQELSKKELIKLNELNVQTESFDLKDQDIQDDLFQILELENKRKTNKTVGIILTSLSAVSLLVGVSLVSSDKHLDQAAGIIHISGGVLYGGVSIPFWNASKRRKKERDRLIKRYQ